MKKIFYKKSADMLKALSHPTRLMIVAELLKEKKCVNDIKGILKTPQPNISQHLGFLKLTGIVISRQKGKERCYCIKKKKFAKSLMSLLKKYKNM